MNVEQILSLLGSSSDSDSVDSTVSLSQYVSRLKLWPKILRRYQEEEILKVVTIPNDWLEDQKKSYLKESSLESVLSQNNWSLRDFEINLSLPEALRLYSEYRFSPGLEEKFLSANGGHDQVIYSVLRVRDPSLAQELWIRIEEGETTFAQLAADFGEGPEATKKGLLGPVPLGSIEPHQLQSTLRSLPVSHVTPPFQIGEWTILVRLEQLTPARFDDKMRSFLLKQQLNSFLDLRVKKLLLGESVDHLEYKSPS